MSVTPPVPLKSERFIQIRLEGAPISWSIVPSTIFIYLMYQSGASIAFYVVWAVVLLAPTFVVSKVLRIGSGTMVCGYAVGRMMIYRLWHDQLNGCESMALDTGHFPNSGESSGGKAFILKLDLGKAGATRNIAVFDSEAKALKVLDQLRTRLEPFDQFKCL